MVGWVGWVSKPCRVFVNLPVTALYRLCIRCLSGSKTPTDWYLTPERHTSNFRKRRRCCSSGGEFSRLSVEHCCSHHRKAMKDYQFLLRLGHLLNTLAQNTARLSRLVCSRGAPEMAT